MTTAAADYDVSNPVVEDGITTWDKIAFGRYFQDAAFEPEPIKWRILSIDDDNNALVLADKNLDVQPYNEEKNSVTWEKCSLRKWLNEDFYYEAFDEKQQTAILETEVVNKDNAEYGTKGGANTNDKVTLLSTTEIVNPEYGFGATLKKSTATRTGENTDYVKTRNAFTSVVDGSVGNGYWWLRSPGNQGNAAAYVHFDGYGNQYGKDVDTGNYSIRPALRIDLSSSEVTDAGEVDSTGKETAADNGYHNPVTNGGVTTWDCVYLGKYKQTARFEKQEIEWRVLSVDGDDAYVMADKSLDTLPYHNLQEGVTWEKCSLRKWLNEEFYNEAFDEEEKSSIVGVEELPKVSLLSINEAKNTAYGFDADISLASDTRESKNTDYAKVQNAWSGIDPEAAGRGYWWLCSEDGIKNMAPLVLDDGHGSVTGTQVSSGNVAVRPVLHIRLSSLKWKKAGWVRSNGEEGGKIVMPTPTASAIPTPTVTPTTAPVITPTPTALPVETVTPEVSLSPKPVVTPLVTEIPTPTPTLLVTPQPVVTDTPTEKPVIPPATTPVSGDTPKPVVTNAPQPVKKLKKITISEVRCKRGSRKITGNVSVRKALVRIKVGNKSYKRATVTSEKFTLKVPKLKKKTKIVIQAVKAGYRVCKKEYRVK